MNLEEYLVKDVEGPTTDNREAWKVTDAASAHYAIRKIAKARAHIAECKAQYDEVVTKAQAWFDKETEEAKNTEAFFTSAMIEYTRAQLAGGKKKTLAFSNGAKASFKSAQPDYEYDADELLEWAQKNAPEYVVSPAPKLAWGELKKQIQLETTRDDEGNIITKAVLKDTGEVLTLISVTAKEDSFQVDTKGVTL